MMVWYVTAPLLVVVALLLYVRRWKSELGALTYRDARLLRSLPTTKLSELKPGLVKLVGIARAEQGVMSYYDRQPCVLHRRVVTTVSGYERVGRATVAHTFTTHEWAAIPFQLDDDGTLLWVDPRTPGTRVDYEIGNSDEASEVQEQFIRLGDRITVVGEIEMLSSSQDYRSSGRTGDASQYARFRGPVLVSWRTDEEFYPKLRPTLATLALGAVGLGGVLAAAWDGQLVMVGVLSGASLLMGLVAMAQFARFAR